MKSLIKKSIAASLLVVFVFNTALAIGDDDGVDKNFRFGIKVNPMLTWFRPGDSKIVEKDGVKAKFGYGLITEFKLGKLVSFATGIGADYEGGKLKFSDTVTYFIQDEAFTTAPDTSKPFVKYMVNSRSYDVNYLNIPLTLKMKTKEIGAMTYFAIFGGDLGIRLKGKVKDNDPVNLTPIPSGFKYSPEDVQDNTKDMNIIRTSLNVGAGFEFNLSGSTSLVVSLNYRRGMLPAIKKESEYLLKGVTSSAFKSTVVGDAFLITAGILF